MPGDDTLMTIKELSMHLRAMDNPPIKPVTYSTLMVWCDQGLRYVVVSGRKRSCISWLREFLLKDS